MDKTTRITLCIFIISLLVGSVSALTLDIVDKSYLQKNEFTITDQNGERVANFTGDKTITLPQGKAYFIDYQPVGLFDFGTEVKGDPFYLNLILGFFLQPKVLAGLIALCGLVIILWKW